MLSLVFLGWLVHWQLALAASPIPPHLSLVEGCTVYNTEVRVVKTLPGVRCLFRDNGDFVSADEKGLRYYDRLGKVLWEIPGHFHHQMNWSSDGTFILAIDSLVQQYRQGARQRFDRLQIVNLAGQVQHSVEVVQLFAQKQLEALKFENKFKTLLGVPQEGSHFNSFYQIPPLVPGTGRPAWLRPGNYLVNSLGLGYFVLDPTLQTVLHHEKKTRARMNLMHDVQVLENGHLFYLNNLSVESTLTNRFSTVEEQSPINGQVLTEVRGSPAALFYTRFGGGAQKVSDDLILFSHAVLGVYLYSIKQRDIIWSTVFIHMKDGGEIHYVQQVKLVDLRNFLKNNGSSRL